MSVGVVDKTTGDRIPTAGNPLDKVGNLANLTTSAKDNAVNAINEVNATKANQTQLATVEESTTASKAYSANDYIVLGGVLYKVTANIAQGGTIVTEGAGKNVDLATVGGELSAINSNFASLKYQMILETSSSGTHAEKLASLATAYSNLTTSQKISSVIVFAGQSVLRNVGINGLFATEYLEANKTEITMAKLSGEYLSSVNGTVSDYSSVSNRLKFALWAAL